MYPLQQLLSALLLSAWLIQTTHAAGRVVQLITGETHGQVANRNSSCMAAFTSSATASAENPSAFVAADPNDPQYLVTLFDEGERVLPCGLQQRSWVASASTQAHALWPTSPDPGSSVSSLPCCRPPAVRAATCDRHAAAHAHDRRSRAAVQLQHTGHGLTPEQQRSRPAGVPTNSGRNGNNFADTI